MNRRTKAQSKVSCHVAVSKSEVGKSCILRTIENTAASSPVTETVHLQQSETGRGSSSDADADFLDIDNDEYDQETDSEDFRGFPSEPAVPKLPKGYKIPKKESKRLASVVTKPEPRRVVILPQKQRSSGNSKQKFDIRQAGPNHRRKISVFPRDRSWHPARSKSPIRKRANFDDRLGQKQPYSPQSSQLPSRSFEEFRSRARVRFRPQLSSPNRCRPSIRSRSPVRPERSHQRSVNPFKRLGPRPKQTSEPEKDNRQAVPPQIAQWPVQTKETGNQLPSQAVQWPMQLKQTQELVSTLQAASGSGAQIVFIGLPFAVQAIGASSVQGTAEPPPQTAVLTNPKSAKKKRPDKRTRALLKELAEAKSRTQQ